MQITNRPFPKKDGVKSTKNKYIVEEEPKTTTTKKYSRSYIKKTPLETKNVTLSKEKIKVVEE